MYEAIIISLTVLVLVLASFGFRLYQTTHGLRARYAPIIDADAELASVKDQVSRATQGHQAFLSESNHLRVELTQEYARARATYETLTREISLLEENLEDISFGLYRPHFTFQTSEEYKTQLETLRNRERQLIHEGRAALCSLQWTVGGSAREGARMARQNMKLVLRAFNGECDAALTKVAWNNITKMEERVRKSFDAINKLGSVLQVSITDEFLHLKLDELRLTHEYEEKRRQEQEEQRSIREQMREEEKAQREMEKAREEAEREEARFEKALQRARAEAALATGEQVQGLNERIQSLEGQLEEARRQKERAVSRAQLTKSGHVYIISNIGSFGEHVYKVGMTRRWEPMDRVKELGDASVPFPFDVHAMLYSENAPELENAIHRFLDQRRINLINARKEFFQVTLDEIEKFARDRGITIEFTMLAEAKEYRETISRREQRAIPSVQETEKFPPTLFGNADNIGGSGGDA